MVLLFPFYFLHVLCALILAVMRPDGRFHGLQVVVGEDGTLLWTTIIWEVPSLSSCFFEGCHLLQPVHVAHVRIFLLWEVEVWSLRPFGISAMSSHVTTHTHTHTHICKVLFQCNSKQIDRILMHFYRKTRVYVQQLKMTNLPVKM